MNTKQLLLVTLIQAIVTIMIYPFIPEFTQFVSGGNEIVNNLSEVYTIIFSAGVVTMLIFGLILVGRGEKYELYFTLSALAFLAIIFYQNFSTMPIQTIISLVLASIIFKLKTVLRKIVINKSILS